VFFGFGCCTLLLHQLALRRQWIPQMIPGGTAFATKPQLAAMMISQALDTAIPVGW
jgi:hypothetical protein